MEGSRQSCRRYCELTTAQAFAAFILRDIGRWLVIFIPRPPDRDNHIIAAIGPVQVLASMIRPENSAVRFRRRGQYKRGTHHRAQFAALLNAPAAHLLLRIGVTVSLTKFTASRKRA